MNTSYFYNFSSLQKRKIGSQKEAKTVTNLVKCLSKKKLQESLEKPILNKHKDLIRKELAIR